MYYCTKCNEIYKEPEWDYQNESIPVCDHTETRSAATPKCPDCNLLDGEGFGEVDMEEHEWKCEGCDPACTLPTWGDDEESALTKCPRGNVYCKWELKEKGGK